LRYFILPTTVLILTFGTTIPKISFCQAGKNSPQTAFIRYSFAELGSNLGSFQPVFRLKGVKFKYTLEQNSYWGKKDKRKKKLLTGTFRQSSIDSILYLVQNLKDSTIFETNFCIKSGGIHHLTVSNGIDTTKFRLNNTFDYTALKIVAIINDYLPIDKKIWVTEKLITDQKACMEYLFQELNKSEKK